MICEARPHTSLAMVAGISLSRTLATLSLTDVEAASTGVRRSGVLIGIVLPLFKKTPQRLVLAAAHAPAANGPYAVLAGFGRSFVEAKLLQLLRIG